VRRTPSVFPIRISQKLAGGAAGPEVPGAMPADPSAEQISQEFQ